MQMVEPGQAPLRRLASGKAGGQAKGRAPGTGAPKGRASKGRQADKTRGASGSRIPGQSPHSLSSFHLTPEIEAELVAIAAASGCELLHVEWKGGVLRLILDRAEPAAAQDLAATPAILEEEAAEGSGTGGAAAPAAAGVSLGDCEHVAKLASALLDVLDFGGGRYVLEVSSPGLDRELYRASDYRRFLGRLARVTYEAAGGEGRTVRRTIVARLSEWSEVDAGTVTLTDERTGERLALKLASIRLARLEVEL
jgi:ribosome maturation factor RimP